MTDKNKDEEHNKDEAVKTQATSTQSPKPAEEVGKKGMVTNT